MSTPAARVPLLAVGDPTRTGIGRAAVASLWTAAAFVVYLWIAKEIPALYVHEPWQNDPYDAVVSFAFFFVPILAGLCVTRAALCRRSSPLPVRRARELLVASRLMLAVAAVTLAAEWASVALGAERAAWDSTTVLLLVCLGLMTMLVAVAAALVMRALRVTPSADRGPDWWADALAAVDEYLPFGFVAKRFAKSLIGWSGRAARGRPLITAAVLSITFGAFLAAGEALAEGGFAAPVLVLYISVAAASMFAFLVAAGAHLHLAGERRSIAGSPRRLVDATAVAAAAFVGALAFREALQPITALLPGRGVAHLLAGCAVVAVGAGAAVFAVETGLRTHRLAETRGE
ncbi:MAG TPA: hypothetical protein VFB69_02500 [Candidatus Dormibacteraeota bacterium]|nr:hypothetical protein [Candidatus Dormibacteraeota bacterium]